MSGRVADAKHTNSNYCFSSFSVSKKGDICRPTGTKNVLLALSTRILLSFSSQMMIILTGKLVFVKLNHWHRLQKCSLQYLENTYFELGPICSHYQDFSFFT